uniref:Fork-head domain-containing protein n=1 Tax=Heterorhabditis bacteriophora TaxID=37862 RepID=A0A1I7XN84_HETBA
MVGLSSEDLPDLNWFLNIGGSPSPPSLLSQDKNCHSFDKKRAKKSSVTKFQPILIRTTDTIDYREVNLKPPLSYAQIILEAMTEKKVDRVTLSEIYDFARRRFAYYRHSKGPWKNSIRHNLSCNQMFKKIPRKSDDKGKGSYWTVNEKFVKNEANLPTLKSKHHKTKEQEDHSRKAGTKVNTAVLNYMDSIRTWHKTVAPEDHVDEPSTSETPIFIPEMQMTAPMTEEGVNESYQMNDRTSLPDLNLWQTNCTVMYQVEDVPYVGQFEEYYNEDLVDHISHPWQDITPVDNCYNNNSCFIEQD